MTFALAPDSSKVPSSGFEFAAFCVFCTLNADDAGFLLMNFLRTTPSALSSLSRWMYNCDLCSAPSTNDLATMTQICNAFSLPMAAGTWSTCFPERNMETSRCLSVLSLMITGAPLSVLPRQWMTGGMTSV